MLSITQAAAALGMTPGAVRKAIQQGRLAVTRLSPRIVLISPAEIERYRTTPRRPGGRPRRS